MNTTPKNINFKFIKSSARICFFDKFLYYLDICVVNI